MNEAVAECESWLRTTLEKRINSDAKPLYVTQRVSQNEKLFDTSRRIDGKINIWKKMTIKDVVDYPSWILIAVRDNYKQCIHYINRKLAKMEDKKYGGV